jgi:hypothetical protein
MPDMTIDDITSGGGKLPPIIGTKRKPPSNKIPKPLPPPRRRGAAPVILATAPVIPEPPRRRRAPVITVDEMIQSPTEDDALLAKPQAAAGRFTVAGGHRPLPVYWQHHGAPDYVRRHAEELCAFRRAIESADRKRLDDITDMMIVNLFMYEDALRRFNAKPQLTDEQFDVLREEMIGAYDNTPKGGCHREIIQLDGKDVFMKWHGGAGDIVRDSANAMIYFGLLAHP